MDYYATLLGRAAVSQRGASPAGIGPVYVERLLLRSTTKSGSRVHVYTAVKHTRLIQLLSRSPTSSWKSGISRIKALPLALRVRGTHL